jgi:hypothetical protein
VPASVADFEQIVAKLVAGEQVAERLQPHLAAADAVSERRKFFHWALEFPEVFFERGGFDAVIGNPPWNTLSPDVKEFFGTYDPTVFRKGVPKGEQDERKDDLREDDEVDSTWRREARFLHELSNYAKPESGRFGWFTEDGQLRKGDANVFRLFVERAHRLLRTGGRLSQVLPDSVYVSSPATGVREHLLRDGVLERCWVFENRRGIFPIDSRIKIVLLVAQRGGGPTDAFRAAFLTGKDAVGRERAIGLDTLPDVLTDLDEHAPVLTAEQVRALAPATLAFPELQTALDAEIASQCQLLPPLNLDKSGWGLVYAAEVHAHRDGHTIRPASEVSRVGASLDGSWWRNGPDKWLPIVQGQHFHSLAFLTSGQSIDSWIREADFAVDSRRNIDGSSFADYFRFAWRRIARSVDERSAIACVVPPGFAVEESALTVRGGSISARECVILAALVSSFSFDYMVRLRGTVNLRYGTINSVPAPPAEELDEVVAPAAAVLMQSPWLEGLGAELGDGYKAQPLTDWEIGDRRSAIDALVASAYGLSLPQFGAILVSFPNIDRSQPMLPGEPKSFVTRDLALKAFCDLTGVARPNVAKLMREIGSGLPDPRPEHWDIHGRLAAYQEMGAVPYRPTPKGARMPTDPSLIEDVRAALSDDAQSGEEIAEALGEDTELISKILKDLRRTRDVYVEGRGKNARYYVVGDD